MMRKTILPRRRGRQRVFTQHERRRRATIEAHYSEVRLEPYRETDGDGQGSGLSGEAESQFAGLRFARLAAAD
jgi:hypothetical protein